MSAIERSLFRNSCFDSDVVTHEILSFLPPRETGIFLNTVTANPRLLQTEHAPDLRCIYRETTLKQLRNNNPSAALRIAVESKNYLLLKQLLKPGAVFDFRYTLDKAFRGFAAQGNVEGMSMILQSARRNELQNFEAAFKKAHPLAISYMLDPANHINLWQEAIKDRLICAGRYTGRPAAENRQVIEAILTSPGTANWIGDHFFLIANNGLTREYYEALNQNIELFAPSLEGLDMAQWSFSSSGILKHACEFNCFEIIRKVIENPNINHLERNNEFHSIYQVETEWLQQCSAKCARAGHAELADQINTTIAKRGQLCTRASFAVRANILPKIRTLVSRAFYGDSGSFVFAFSYCLGLVPLTRSLQT